MANFINKIKIGEVTYSIGMENALHFDGLALIGTWFVDAACKTAATANDLKESQGFLYYNAATIGAKAVTVGCVYIPATGTASAMVATGYELVCVEVSAANVSKWAILGEVKKETATGVLAVGTASKTVVTSVSDAKAAFIASVTPGTASIAAGVATANVNVITAAPTSATVAAQDVVAGIDPKSTTINYGKSISAGSVTANHVSTSAPVSANVTVSGGGVTVATADAEIECTEASGAAGKVAITLTNGTAKSVVTALSSTAKVVTSVSSEDTHITVTTDNTLVLPVTVLTALAGAQANASALGSTGSIAVPTAAAMAANVITAVNTAVVTHTVNVVTGAKHTNPTVKVALPTSVVTGVSYTAPTLITAAQAVVSSVSATTASIGAVATDAKLIASVPYAAKAVATAAGAAKTVVTGITTGSASAVTAVTGATGSVKEVTSVTTGTVVTAVL